MVYFWTKILVYFSSETCIQELTQQGHDYFMQVPYDQMWTVTLNHQFFAIVFHQFGKNKSAHIAASSCFVGPVVWLWPAPFWTVEHQAVWCGFYRSMLHIREGKGRKDRYVPFGKLLCRGLRTYINAEHPYVWLFNGKDNTGQLQQFSELLLKDANDILAKKMQ